MDAVAYFKSAGLAEEERVYLQYHAPRLEFCLALVRRLLADVRGRRAHVLDVGPHFLTQLIRDGTDCVVDQLGFRYDAVTRPREGEAHHEIELNSLADRALWQRIGPYDVILAAEVIEHLHISPVFFLGFLRECLAPGGHLVVQTPNGVALKRRLAMLLGRNPFELIRESAGNPGHFREYTRREMVDYARGVGLEPVSFESRVYFDYSRKGLGGRAYGALARLLPAGFRDGMTFVFRRAGAGSA